MVVILCRFKSCYPHQTRSGAKRDPGLFLFLREMPAPISGIFFSFFLHAGLGAKRAPSLSLFISNAHATKLISFSVPCYSVTLDSIRFEFSVIFYIRLPDQIVRHLFSPPKTEQTSLFHFISETGLSVFLGKTPISD